MFQSSKLQTTTEETPVNVHALTVFVCQDCIDLKGVMCNNAECVFCRRTMVEVQQLLDAMLLCPIVDGKRLILVGDAVTNEDTRSPATAAPVVDEQALKKRARQIIDAVIQSPVIVEVRAFSQPEEVDKLEDRVAALLRRFDISVFDAEEVVRLVAERVFPHSAHSSAIKELAQGVAAHFAAATAAPVEQSDVTEELRDTNMLCRSGEGRPKVEIWFKDLKAAQKVHRWLVSLAANTNEEARSCH